MPELASLDISPEYLDKTHFRNPPKVEIGPDGQPRYRGEADDIDSSPTLLPGPLSSNVPLLADPRSTGTSPPKRKRYDPYSATPKRTRKAKGPSTPSASPDEPTQPHASTQPQQQPQAHSESNLAVIHHPPYPPYGMPSYYQMPGYPLPPPHPHLYPPGPYLGTTAGPSTAPAQGAPASSPNPPFAYHGYPAPSTMDASQAAQQPSQQAFYPYYPPPHGHYPGYGGVAWPHYTGYPPQPIIHHPVIASSAAVSEIENKNSTSMESAEHDAEDV